MRIGIVLAILASTGAARAADPHDFEASISTGVGFAYEIAGLDLGLRYRHVEAYVGFGLLSVLHGAAAGLRVYPESGGEGLFFALNASEHRFTMSCGDDDGPVTSTQTNLWIVSLTPGFRWSWDMVFVQAALGLALIGSSDTGAGSSVLSLPDVMLALGTRF